MDRSFLYERINKRVDQMLEKGLFDEVKRLYDYRSYKALQTVGYTELFDHLDGKTSFDGAVELIKRNSRRYAKRQLTWFRKMDGATWFDTDQKHEVLPYIEKRIIQG